MLALLPEWLDPEKILNWGGPALLFAIIYAESGLLIGFFLPGDSLLFTAGAVAAGAFDQAGSPLEGVHFNIWVLMIGCFLAAVLGDQTGYLIGKKAGPRLFNREDSKFFKKSHVQKGTEFFEKHGGRAIILARFVPIVRTFVPTIAGVSEMRYRDFLRYNVVGGLIWGVGVTLLGFVFGRIEVVQNNIEVALIGVVVISLLPIVFEVVKHRREAASKTA